MDEVISAILSGEKERFREIVHAFNMDFLRIARAYLGDWESAKDVTQISFIRVYRSLDRFRPGSAFRPWAFRIHLNVCKSAARSQKLMFLRRAPLTESYAAAEHTEATSVHPAILKQIAALSAKQRAAFVLVEISGFTQKEAADVLKCGESTLRVHLARARATLRERLTRLGFKND